MTKWAKYEIGAAHVDPAKRHRWHAWLPEGGSLCRSITPDRMTGRVVGLAVERPKGEPACMLCLGKVAQEFGPGLRVVLAAELAEEVTAALARLRRSPHVAGYPVGIGGLARDEARVFEALFLWEVTGQEWAELVRRRGTLLARIEIAEQRAHDPRWQAWMRRQP